MGKKAKKTHWVIFGFFPDRKAGWSFFNSLGINGPVYLKTFNLLRTYPILAVFPSF